MRPPSQAPQPFSLLSILLTLTAVFSFTGFFFGRFLQPTFPNLPPLLFAAVAGLPTLLISLITAFITERTNRRLHLITDLSEAIRWRGYLEDDEKNRLRQVAQGDGSDALLATSLLELQEENQNRLAQLTTLFQSSQALITSLEASDVVTRILAQMERVFGVEMGAVLAHQPREGTFRMIASRNMGDYANFYNAQIADANLPSMRALRKREPVQVADTEADLGFAPFRERAQQQGFRSVLAIPLKTQHAPPAVLLLYKTKPYRYSYSELELAVTFAVYASVALENAALYQKTDERLQEQTSRLQAIMESMRDGLILEGLNGRILFANQRIAQLLGQPAANLQGETTAQFTKPLLKTADRLDPHTLELHNQNPPRDWRIHQFDVTDHAGELVGRGQLWQEITRDKELERMKSSLVSTVSHELRTPLATIKGYASTLLAPDVTWDAASQREFLQTISDETDRLTMLVKNLLDLSRIEAGSLDIAREPYSLNDLLPAVLHGFPADMQSRFQTVLDLNLPLSLVDPSRIAAAIRNLLENSLNYSGETTLIEIRSWAENGRVCLAVRDFGVGITPDQLPHIFDRFYCADSSLARQSGGVGLGLAICKGFVEAHDGTIAAHPKAKGTEFIITLPAIPQSINQSTNQPVTTS